MKRLMTSVVSVALFMLAGCGGDTPATITNDIVANFKSMTDVFNSITDEASAKAAVPKIETIRASMRAVNARAKAVKVSESEMAKFEAEGQKAMATAMPGLMAARMKLEEVFEKNPAVKKIIEPALDGMEKDMK